MIFPERLREAVEANALKYDRKELAKAAAAISERYREEKGDGSRLVTKGCETAAYAAVRMPATFAAVSNALEHSLAHIGCGIESAADIGAGTGAAGWAVSELAESLTTLHCFERETQMRELGKQLAGEAEIGINTEWFGFDTAKDTLSRSYDLIVMSYTLNELSESDRDRAVDMLWEKTDKLLLIVEPGTKAGFANIQRARERLIKAGADIAYPCPGNVSCPLPADDWCHFTARVQRTKLHKQLKGGDVPYEDEKFSCIAAAKCKTSPCGRRILRHPQISGGFVDLRVCTDGGISDIRITKSQKEFKAARKSDCGDSI